LPTLATFYGIDIAMYWRDHNPPHFHARFGGEEALIDIRALEILRGRLPRGALLLVLEWAREHKDELIEDWTLCANMELPKTIAPLP
jgi:hypothetical protein